MTEVGAVARARSGTRRPAALTTLLSVLAVPTLAGCAPSPNDHSVIRVHAASSLTEAFTELAERFSQVHPERSVALTFAGSQVLRLQIERGAPVDVFASADPNHVDALVDSELVFDPVSFASNGLAVIIPDQGRATSGLESFATLNETERLVLGTSAAPVGRYAREALTRGAEEFGSAWLDDVLARVVSEESNTRLVRAKVALGEASAAIVYRTDALASEGVAAIPVPERFDVRAEYQMATTRRSTDPDLWIDFVTSDIGAEVLSRHGFGPPR